MLLKIYTDGRRLRRRFFEVITIRNIACCLLAKIQYLKNPTATIITKTSSIMIPRIKKITALDNFILFVEFDDGYKVMYDVKDDIETLPSFRALTDVYGLFKQVQLDSSRTCVYWNDEIDLPSDCLYEYGKAA